ncbi:MAG: DUF3093 domain-containing protein [Nocardioidaceae bacterium]
MTVARTPRFEERLRVPASWWLLGLGAVVTIWWIIFVALSVAAASAVAALAAGVVAAGLWRYGAASIAADADGLRAGRAVLPTRHIGTVEPLDAERTRRALGVDADARAYLLVRAYCPESVKVSVDDPADPTPYWVISTRQAASLASSLHRARVQD